MAKTKQTKTTKEELVPTPAKVPVVLEEQDWTPSAPSVNYVVTRDGLRVSERDYTTKNDPLALAERDFWKRIVTQWPDGTKVEIVQFDKKKHRIW